MNEQIPFTPPQIKIETNDEVAFHPKHTSASLIIFVSIALLAVLALIGWFGIRTRYQAAKTKKSVKTDVSTKKSEVIRRSKNPNIIKDAVTAKEVDSKTGKIIQATELFTLSDKTVYLALNLNTPPAGTYIDYVRYLNNHFVDHGNIKITNSSTRNLTLSWTNKPTLGNVGDGKWNITSYTNGKLEKRVSYIVKKNTVLHIDEEPLLASLDPNVYFTYPH